MACRAPHLGLKAAPILLYSALPCPALTFALLYHIESRPILPRRASPYLLPPSLLTHQKHTSGGNNLVLAWSLDFSTPASTNDLTHYISHYLPLLKGLLKPPPFRPLIFSNLIIYETGRESRQGRGCTDLTVLFCRLVLVPLSLYTAWAALHCTARSDPIRSGQSLPRTKSWSTQIDLMALCTRASASASVSVARCSRRCYSEKVRSPGSGSGVRPSNGGWGGWSVLGLMAGAGVLGAGVMRWQGDVRRVREREYSSPEKFVEPKYATIRDMEAVSKVCFSFLVCYFSRGLSPALRASSE